MNKRIYYLFLLFLFAGILLSACSISTPEPINWSSDSEDNSSFGNVDEGGDIIEGGGVSDTREEDKAPDIKDYDGVHPASGTTSTSRGWPVNAPLNSSTSDRNPTLYGEVLDQFGVANNPRYDPNAQGTMCNIFVWDATRAMGAEIPHWVDKNGKPMTPASAGSHELNANRTVVWLRDHGADNGWKKVSASEAAQMAQAGHPVVAGWEHLDGNKIGHVAMVRPESTTGNLLVAQAGGTNTNSGKISKMFSQAYKDNEIEYYVHD